MNYIIYGAIPESLLCIGKSEEKIVKKPLQHKAKKRLKTRK